jgi:LPS export ABC transporter protein LptC
MKWFVIVLVSVLIGGISLGSRRPSASSGYALGLVRLASTDLLPDIRAQRIQVLAQSDSVANWKVTAEDAAFYSEGQLTVLHSVFMQYMRQTSPLLQMIATRGQIDNATGDVTVEGAVRLKYHDSYVIETERISWRALDHVLYTDLPVKIYNPSVQITGQELKGDMDRYHIALQGNVRASFQLR